MKNVKIINLDNEISKKVKEELEIKLLKAGFAIDDNNIDIGIAIGGDGTFLKLIKELDYDENILYVGINTGTLGFLQEVSVDEIDLLVNKLKNKDYKVTSTMIQKTVIDDSISFFSINEIIIKRRYNKIFKMDISVDDIYLEKFVGDGVMISTSIGSTAHSMSYGGAIIDNNLDVLQIVKMGVFNSLINKSINNPIILSKEKKINFKILDESEMLIIADGIEVNINKAKDIKTMIYNNKINRIKLDEFSFCKKVRSKFI